MSKVFFLLGFISYSLQISFNNKPTVVVFVNSQKIEEDATIESFVNNTKSTSLLRVSAKGFDKLWYFYDFPVNQLQTCSRIHVYLKTEDPKEDCYEVKKGTVSGEAIVTTLIKASKCTQQETTSIVIFK